MHLFVKKHYPKQIEASVFSKPSEETIFFPEPDQGAANDILTFANLYSTHLVPIKRTQQNHRFPPCSPTPPRQDVQQCTLAWRQGMVATEKVMKAPGRNIWWFYWGPCPQKTRSSAMRSKFVSAKLFEGNEGLHKFNWNLVPWLDLHEATFLRGGGIGGVEPLRFPLDDFCQFWWLSLLVKVIVNCSTIDIDLLFHLGRYTREI